MGMSRRQLGVQVHCLRREMAADFCGALQRLRSMGFEKVELCSFPGCTGNPWGDFGQLAEWRPDDIRASLDAARLDCPATHVTYRELAADDLDATIAWAKGVGCRTIVLAALPVPAEPSLASWREAFKLLNGIGKEVAVRGLKFAYHTQNDVWQSIDGTLLADEMFRLVDAGVCRIELDPSGAIVSGTDWQCVVRRNRDRFIGMHLRDGMRPPGAVPYLPALPLGEGEIDWLSAIETTADAGVTEYFLEMEVDSGRDVFDAIDASVAHLASQGILEGAVH